MTDHIDHAAEAIRIAALTDQFGRDHATSGTLAAATATVGAIANGFAHAQVHATLAIAQAQQAALTATQAGLETHQAERAIMIGARFLAHRFTDADIDRMIQRHYAEAPQNGTPE